MHEASKMPDWLSPVLGFSAAELDLFEPADGIALVGNDLGLPDDGNRHDAHEEKADDESKPQMQLANLNPTNAANPFHGGVLLVLGSLFNTTAKGTRRVSWKYSNRNATEKSTLIGPHRLQNK
jgi:hypothetical protein